MKITQHFIEVVYVCSFFWFIIKVVHFLSHNLPTYTTFRLMSNKQFDSVEMLVFISRDTDGGTSSSQH